MRETLLSCRPMEWLLVIKQRVNHCELVGMSSGRKQRPDNVHVYMMKTCSRHLKSWSELALCQWTFDCWQGKANIFPT